MIKCMTFKMLSIFLSYPTKEIQENINDSILLIEKEKIIETYKIKNFTLFIKEKNIFFLQEYYVSIFDKNKDFSLYLFEHIHGDSRERGMAMVDLIELYKKSNIFIKKKNELPDYIPLFLEYLSLLNLKKSQNILSEIINIITLLKKRLENINSCYSAIFESLEFLSPIKCDEKIINKKINENKNTLILDKEWEEPKAF